MLLYLTAVLSSLFRIGVFLFLRVLPSGILRRVLPVLYVLYLSTLYLTPNRSSERVEVVQNGNAKDDNHDEKESKVSHLRVVRQETAQDPLTTVLFSIPSPARLLNLTNLAINTVLFLFALEFVLYPVIDDAADVVFTRIGAVYPDSAKVVVRYPSSEVNATDRQVRLLWRQASGLEATWNSGPEVNLTADHDWVDTARLTGLWPSTNYEYVLADSEGTPLPYPAEPIKFHTFPDPRLPTGTHFRFIVSSCATPNFPYAPLQGRRIRGFDLLADYLWPTKGEVPSEILPNDNSSSPVTDTAVPAEFMLFLGDFIYADVPMYFGDDAETYRRFYRRNYQSDSLRKVYERLPMFHTYDDHEIINNYVGQGNDSTPPFANAADAFRLYNADANYDPQEPGQHYYDFRYGDVAFFVMDTRRYRSDITQGDEAARTMLGDKQLGALHEWLAKVNETTTWKFIVSSVPFTSLWTFEANTDSWNPYSYEKASLLTALHSVKNVIILSGDRHEFATIKFNGEGSAHSIVEVSTSPMSMFWVPLIRTLRDKSEETVKHLKEITNVVDGQVVTEYVEEEVPQEEVLKYVPQGNYKWSTFEVDTRDPKHPKVRLELMADGVPVYELEIDGKPVEISVATALEAFVPKGIKGVLDKIGLNPSKWW